MESVQENIMTTERRQFTPSKLALMSRLSTSQKFAVNSLTRYGYQIAFTRNTDQGSLAILMCDNNIATVDDQGDINTDPSIIIRT
ncbi:hypothetical protein [Colwellia sp. MEBiC06753]